MGSVGKLHLKELGLGVSVTAAFGSQAALSYLVLSAMPLIPLFTNPENTQA